jgi:hypothetical protein
MEYCPRCSQPLMPIRAKLVCRTPGCGFMENCCDGGFMPRGEPINADRLRQCDGSYQRAAVPGSATHWPER